MMASTNMPEGLFTKDKDGLELEREAAALAYQQVKLSTPETSKNGLQHGEAKVRFANKMYTILVNEGTFKGDYENGFRSQTGLIVWDDKAEFHGQFDTNMMAFGTLTWYDKDGNLNRYMGLFKCKFKRKAL